jgi:uncharacterized protein
MRWSGGRGSGNIEDRRGMGPGMVGGGIGVVVLALVGALLGVDLTGLAPSGGGTQQPQGGAPPADDAQSQAVDRVLESTEVVWTGIFQQLGQQYQEPTLVLFSGATSSACGLGQAAMGPFYCPPDQQVYIDLSFYEDMERQLGAPGDFAQAYVIAHEVGHHVQNLLGISGQVSRAQRNAGSQEEANQLSVRLELQADCFAGVWGYHAQRQQGAGAITLTLEPGDAEEALNAASAIGDDRLQKQSQGRVVPESFTHGTSDQRMHWFQQGLQSGDVNRCDTFQPRSL